MMNKDFFTVNLAKAKHLYAVKHNKTSIDNFVIKLNKEFGETFLAVSVKGLSAGKNCFGFKQLPYGFKQIALYWESPKYDIKKVREYYLKLYVNYDKIPMRICNLEWVHQNYQNLEESSEKDFYYNRDTAFRLIESFFKKHTKYFMVSVFCGILPHSSWSSRCYIKVVIKLPIKSFDVFEHCGIDNLTEFGTNYRSEIKDEFCKICDSTKLDLSKLFSNKKERDSLIRQSENNVRKQKGIKYVGDTFINETLLANYTKQLFPDTIRQYNPKWLGKYLLDIFIPSLSIAVEYHGEQHYTPVERFGGKEKFLQQQARDEFVRSKCQQYNVKLLEWHFSNKVTKESVYELFSTHVDITGYKRPLTLFD